MFLLFAFLLLMALWKWRELLYGAIGLLLGYLVLLSGLDMVFTYVPSPLGVRAAVLLLGVLLVIVAAKRTSLRDNTVKAVLLYFLGLTLLSTLVLWVTEGSRVVKHQRPVELLTSVSMASDGKEVRQEIHTFTEGYELQGERLINCWFTAISAACVTGLIVTDTSTMTLSGQIVILVTIQAGGLGIIFFTAMLGFFITRGISKKQVLPQLHVGTMEVRSSVEGEVHVAQSGEDDSLPEEIVQIESVALDVDPRFARRLLRQVLLITFACELGGTLILGSYYQWLEPATALRGVNPWWWALFHSVSAFNNAGFSLHADNLMSFATDPIVNATISSLIILGGLGYAVLVRMWLWLRANVEGRSGKVSQLIDHLELVQASKLQTWLCLHTTFFLLLLGTVAVLVIDWASPSYAAFNFSERIMIAGFHSVSARTAGFNTVDLGKWSCGTLIIYMFLMYIGACPQGTAGGIKVTSLRLLMAYVGNWFRAPYQHVVIRGRGEDWLVHRDTMTAAVRLFFASLLIVVGGVMLIALFEREHLIVPDNQFDFLKVCFETVSAFGTVGLSMGYDGALVSFCGLFTADSKIVLILEMLIGRLGALTILAVFPWRRDFGAVDLCVDERMKKVQVG